MRPDVRKVFDFSDFPKRDSSLVERENKKNEQQRTQKTHPDFIVCGGLPLGSSLWSDAEFHKEKIDVFGRG